MCVFALVLANSQQDVLSLTPTLIFSFILQPSSKGMEPNLDLSGTSFLAFLFNERLTVT